MWARLTQGQPFQVVLTLAVLLVVGLGIGLGVALHSSPVTSVSQGIWTVALVLVILLIFSGEVLRGFAFTMLVGIITGTYSSIYIASAFVVDALIAQKKLDPNAERDFTIQHEKVLNERRAAGARA